jgi:hypothetical protein
MCAKNSFNITLGQFGNFKPITTAFHGVNWKILVLSKVLLHFAEKGGDDCFDVIHVFVNELS